MGQYYQAILKDPESRRMIRGNPHHFCEGIKLMEHGYVDSTFVNIVFSMLRDHPMHLTWVGDYAERRDLNKFGTDPNLVNKFIKFAWEAPEKDSQQIERHYDGEKLSGMWFGQFTVINHTKKEFFNQNKYWNRNFSGTNPRAEYAIDPLVALTAVGNGKGGGDFWGKGDEEVGRWATDLIEIVSISDVGEKSLIRDGYKEIEPCFIEGGE